MVEATTDSKGASQCAAAPGANAVVPAHGQAPLPNFILRQGDGLYVALQSLDSPAHLFEFIDNIFSFGLRFADLEYARLHRLLYEWGAAEIVKAARDFHKAGKLPVLRMAADIVPFPPQRQQYYRKAALIENGDAAVYMFEPVLIERIVEQPLCSEPGPDAGAQTAERSPKTVTERVQLDFDEFIAAMWGQDVRYGIDVAFVKKALLGDRSERAVIARMHAPTQGRDASVEELIDSLHRDNTPKLLADGRVDLCQFQNRFPQVKKDTKLIRKVARIPGKSGWDIAGREILPETPRDIDIATLAGLGTTVERTADGEFVVAVIGGFLQIDTASQSLSIAEKIINREGVSLRTTGNLALSGDEYEEHGEVQERAQIEGKNMTFMANVFGNIISHGGRIVLKRNLAAGSIRSPGGVISVEGTASGASLEAIGGDITLHHAENCRIVGRKVCIETAVLCDILAQELIVETSEGCALAAQKMQIGTTAARRDVETTISMLVPDMSSIEKKLNELTREQSECASAVQAKSEEIEMITGLQAVRNYLVLSAKLRAKELNMTAEQAANWQKLLTRVAPMLQRIKTLNDESRQARGTNETLIRTIQELTGESTKMSSDISCSVAAISGETMIRTLKVHPEHAALETMQPRELRVRLRESGADCTALFNGSSGEFEWKFSEAGEPEAPE